jgi:hypothetical protein
MFRPSFIATKDAILSRFLEKTLFFTIREYATMLNLKLNSQKKTIELEILLKGEQEPLKIMVNEFELLARDGKHLLCFRKITASREWIDILTRQYLQNLEIEIPEKVAKALTLII